MLRRDTRRRLDQFIANPNCQANVLSAVHDIPMLQVARSLGFDPQSGQSPFAIGRGVVFERSLYADGAARLFAALVAAGVLSASASGFVDLRTRLNGGDVPNLDVARARFEAMLRSFAAARGRGAGRAARDRRRARAAHPGAGHPAGRDVRGGRRDGPPGAAAGEGRPPRGRDQGLPRSRRAHRSARARDHPGAGGHLRPRAPPRGGRGGRRAARSRSRTRASSCSRARARTCPACARTRTLRFQAKRAERAFERLREAAAQADALPGDAETEEVPKPRLAVVADAPKAYDEACVSFCELEGHCHALAVKDESPALLGRDVARFLGAISLARASALLDGARAETAAEEDFVRRAADARKVA